jgi:hypothetical protein
MIISHMNPIVYWQNPIRNDILNDVFQCLFYKVIVCIDLWSLSIPDYWCFWGYHDDSVSRLFGTVCRREGHYEL